MSEKVFKSHFQKSNQALNKGNGRKKFKPTLNFEKKSFSDLELDV